MAQNSEFRRVKVRLESVDIAFFLLSTYLADKRVILHFIACNSEMPLMPRPFRRGRLILN